MAKAIRWDQQQLDVHKKRLSRQCELERRDVAVKRFQALGRMPKNRMNRTETEYAAILDDRKRRGEILWWAFHPLNVRLADATFYEVDFLVMTGDMRLQIHETKGEFTTEKGQMKIKLCAEALPCIPFFKAIKIAKKRGGGWKEEAF